MGVTFTIEGERLAVPLEVAVELAAQLRAACAAHGEELGDDLAAAIVIEHELVERRSQPLAPTSGECQALLAAIHALLDRSRSESLLELYVALRRRRQLELGLELP